MSAKGKNCYSQNHEEISQTKQTKNDGNFTFPSTLKCEDEENDTKYLPSRELNQADASVPPCCIKNESEDSQDQGQQYNVSLKMSEEHRMGWELIGTHQIKAENVALKEEIDIEEHKLGLELTWRSDPEMFIDEPDQCDVVETYKSDRSVKRSESEKENSGRFSFQTNSKQCFFTRNLFKDINTECTEMYKCNKCQYQTKIKSELILHCERVHSKLQMYNHSNVYKCDECSFETKNKLNFSKHKYKHSKKTGVYKCHECSFETTSQHYLSLHYGIHGKDAELYKCKECCFKTTRNCYLTQHYNRIHSKDFYKCEECSYEIRYKSGLTRHYKNKHAKEVNTIKKQ